MKMFKVILLGAIFAMLNNVSFAKGGGGSGGGSRGGSNTAGGASANDGAGDKARDQTRVPAADKTGTKQQDKNRIHTPGTGTATPAAVPATN